MFLTISKDKPSGYICHIHAEDSDDLHTVQEFFQRRKIFIVSQNMTQVKIPEKRMFEFELWFQREGYSYEFQCDPPEIEAYPKETEYYRREVFDHSPITMKHLKKYQLDAMGWAVKRNRHIIADEPGLGKCLHGDEKVLIEFNWYDIILLLGHQILIKYVHSKKKLSKLWKRACLYI